MDVNDSGSLSKLTFSGDSTGWGDESRNSKPVTIEIGMTEADFSGAVLGSSGAMVLAAWLKHKVQHTTHCVFGLITFSI